MLDDRLPSKAEVLAIRVAEGRSKQRCCDERMDYANEEIV